MDDTNDLRIGLSESWRAVIDLAIDRGSPPLAVVETMATVAHERFAELFGRPAAASYLRLLAEQFQQADQEEANELVTGRGPPQADARPAALEDAMWPERWRDDLI